MRDHLVDGLLTESTLEAAMQRKSRCTASASQDNNKTTDILSLKKDLGSTKLVECRICHDDDYDINMEAPCSCRGSLKYAHPKCVQRWCNEKGDTTCEICHQQFQPGFTAPPPLFRHGGIHTNFRGNWEIARRDYHNPGLIAMVSADGEFLDSDFDYSAPSPQSLMCCRVVAIMFMVLLVLRHTLPIVIAGAGDYSATLFTLLILRTVGILLPIYVMVKAITAIQRRRHQQKDIMEDMESGKLQEQVDGNVVTNNSPMPSSKEEEETVKRKYGGIMPKKPPLISKDHERAYFDSADWALGKQGVDKPKGPLEALRPKLQPTQQQTRYRKSPYAPAGGEEAGGAPSEEAAPNE